jgi:hypothetical protein
MERRFYPGFTVYKNGDNPVFVCPHSGPSLLSPNNRDSYSDTVASLCFEKTGGSLVISNLSRKRAFGIDFNRDLPPEEVAINFYPYFMAKKHLKELQQFREKYAFSAKNKMDYLEKKHIFENFWNVIGSLGQIIIFSHRKFTRIKNYPSVMDIVTFEGKGVNSPIIRAIVDEVNAKNDSFLKEIKNFYNERISLETKRYLEKLRESTPSHNLQDVDPYEMKYLTKDFEIIKKYADPKLTKNLEESFTSENFLNCVNNILGKDINPKITIENFFKGKKARTKIDPFFERHFLVMEAEINEFMGYWYPHEAAEILLSIISKLRSAKLYHDLGISQTHVSEFLEEE